jgi:uncharacterized protein (DUF2147 family)
MRESSMPLSLGFAPTPSVAVAVRRLLVLLLAVVPLSFIRPVTAQTRGYPPLPVEGLWEAQEHDGVFLIGHCGDQLCGRLIAIKYDTIPPKDVSGNSECGLMMLTGFVPNGDGPDGDKQWHGTILDPDSGRKYDANIWSPQPGVLKLRGYILGITLFGETQTWTRYNGSIGPNCKMP